MKNQHYKRIFYFLLLVTVFLQYGCKDEEQHVALDDFTLNVASDLLGIDEIQPVVVLPTPKDMTDKIVWESANPAVAQVQSNDQGLVSGIIGLSVGSTTITASTIDGKLKQTIPVRVVIKVKSIKFSQEVKVSPGEVRYDVLFTPENSTIQDLTWTSSDPEVASVDGKGIITAVSHGSSVITATTVEGGKSASVEVFVSGNPPVFGKEYCSITGYGDYCPSEVGTEGAILNMKHSDSAIPTNNYKYYNEDKLKVQRESDFTLNLVQSNNWSWSAVWIDWDGDCNFTDNEKIALFGEYEVLNDGPFSKQIHVPGDAVLGVVRMRVITTDSWGVDLTSFEPCGSIRFGTVKDFDVEIKN